MAVGMFTAGGNGQPGQTRVRALENAREGDVARLAGRREGRQGQDGGESQTAMCTVHDHKTTLPGEGNFRDEGHRHPVL